MYDIKLSIVLQVGIIKTGEKIMDLRYKMYSTEPRVL